MSPSEGPDWRDVEARSLAPEELALLDRFVVLIRDQQAAASALIHLRRRLSDQEREHLAWGLTQARGESGRWQQSK